jgi:hypothetical protein
MDFTWLPRSQTILTELGFHLWKIQVFMPNMHFSTHKSKHPIQHNDLSMQFHPGNVISFFHKARFWKGKLDNKKKIHKQGSFQQAS